MPELTRRERLGNGSRNHHRARRNAPARNDGFALAHVDDRGARGQNDARAEDRFALDARTLHHDAARTDEGAVFDVMSSTATATSTTTTTFPSASPSHALAASHRQTQPTKITPNSSQSSPPTANRNAAKRKRGRKPGSNPPESVAFKRARERDASDDDSGDDDDFGISVGMGGITGVSGTVNGKKGRMARL